MSRIAYGFMAAGLLAVSLPILAATTIGTRAAPVSSASQDSTADTPSTAPTDFSSRGGRGGGGGGRGGGGRGGGRGGGFGGGHGGGHGGGRVGGGHGGGRVGGHTRQVSGRTGGTRTGGTRTGGTRTGGTRTGGTRTGGTRTGGTRTGTATGARTGGTRTGTATGARTGGTRVGAPRVGGTRVGTVRTTTIRNRRFTTFAGRRFWWHGGWRTLIGVSLLTGFAVGPDFYYPDSYVALAEPVCTGYTDDGCTLRWQDVAADDGSTIPQCVQFCPRVRKPVAAGAAAAPVAAAPRSGCEVEVFADKNLGGASFKTSEDQPLLNDDWDKKIASINVISGTWDFTTEQQYNGDAMRLTPGTYRDLGQNWVDQISAFMCAQ